MDNKKKFTVTVERTVNLTVQDIDDIMVSALEGGITYWASEAKVIEEKRVADWGHEQIARGGVLMIRDIENEDEVWELNLEKFLKGFQLWVKNGGDQYGAVCEDGTVDCCNIDGACADEIVQYGLFEDIVFG